MSFDVLDGLTVTGTVSYVSEKAEIDPNGVASYPADVFFQSSDSRIREGMSSAVEFVTREKKNVIAIPVSAVRSTEGGPVVTLANGEIRKVSTGFTDAKFVEIVSGLTVGDSVLY